MRPASSLPDRAGRLRRRAGRHYRRFLLGVAVASDGSAVYCCDVAHRAVFRFRLDTGVLERFADGAGGVGFRNPNAIAFGPDGLLYVGCYEPSQILRIGPDGTVARVAHDPTAHLLCHPTNLAFRDDGLMITANLGRWHLTAISI